jgi:hypothetical protein
VTLSILGLIGAGIVIYIYLVAGEDVEGWTSLMVVLLIVSGVQMLMTGILGEYLWRNLDETRRRPRFIVDRVVKASERIQESVVHHADDHRDERQTREHESDSE